MSAVFHKRHGELLFERASSRLIHIQCGLFGFQLCAIPVRKKNDQPDVLLFKLRIANTGTEVIFLKTKTTATINWSFTNIFAQPYAIIAFVAHWDKDEVIATQQVVPWKSNAGIIRQIVLPIFRSDHDRQFPKRSYYAKDRADRDHFFVLLFLWAHTNEFTITSPCCKISEQKDGRTIRPFSHAEQLYWKQRAVW